MTASQKAQFCLERQGFLIIESGLSYKVGDTVSSIAYGHDGEIEMINQASLVVGEATYEEYQRQASLYDGGTAVTLPGTKLYKVIAE